MSSRLSLASACACSILLAACGGGGTDNTSPATTPEGIYEGTLVGSTYGAFNMIYLEDGTYWSLYGNKSGGVLYVAGFSQGTAILSGKNFTSSNFRDFGFAPAITGTVSGTYTAGSAISGTISVTRGTISFSGAPVATSVMDYNAPASLSAISGSWSLTLLTGETTGVTISSAGAISGTSSLGCTFTGTAAPRASGKNVFNVTVLNGPAPCALPGVTMTGAAVYSANSNGTHNLTMLAVDGGRQYGVGAFGSR